MKYIIFALVGLAFTGCSHSIHLVHVSDFSKPQKINQGEVVESKSEQDVVLGLVDNTSYVDQAYNDLLLKCPHGSVQGITTRYSTSHGFFSWTNKIHMWGLCIKG